MLMCVYVWMDQMWIEFVSTECSWARDTERNQNQNQKHIENRKCGINCEVAKTQQQLQRKQLKLGWFDY